MHDFHCRLGAAGQGPVLVDHFWCRGRAGVAIFDTFDHIVVIGLCAGGDDYARVGFGFRNVAAYPRKSLVHAGILATDEVLRDIDYEGVDDLEPFAARDFARAIVGLDEDDAGR